MTEQPTNDPRAFRNMAQCPACNAIAIPLKKYYFPSTENPIVCPKCSAKLGRNPHILFTISMLFLVGFIAMAVPTVIATATIRVFYLIFFSLGMVFLLMFTVYFIMVQVANVVFRSELFIILEEPPRRRGYQSTMIPRRDFPRR